MRTELTPEVAATSGGAVAEQALRACVHCGMCNATCPTFQIAGDELEGPRGRIYLMKQVLEGATPTRLTLDHLDSCLGCRACETTCPSGVQYHRLYDIGHAAVAAAVGRSWRERLTRWGVRRLSLSPRLFRIAAGLGHSVAFALPANLRAKTAPRAAAGARPRGAHARRMLMLGGCVQQAAAAHFNAAATRIFDRIGIELVEVPQARCCGAVSFHLDAAEEARALARANLDAWRDEIERGAEAIIVTSTGCASFIRDYPDVLRDDTAYLDLARRAADLVRDPVQVLREAQIRPTSAPAQARIAVHEPCSLQHGLRLTGEIAALLGQLGYEPQPVADNHLCCGSAGAYSLLHPEMAGKLKANKLAALGATQPAAIYTANIGCWMHLSDGAPAPVRHWLEAVEAVL